MMPQPDAETSRQIEELAAAIAELTAKRDAAEKRARELLAAEDPKAGVFHAQEIFAAKQEKLALDTDLEIARRRRNRLLLPQ
jgi:hypothetical protein